MIGTDLGEEFDDNFVFPAGMVLVLEPVVWEDGTGGYRSEEIVVITEDGYDAVDRLPLRPVRTALMSTEILPDERALRIGRRERALAQMEAHDLDVLVLGRQANVRYVTGAPQLWVAGTRPFGPICVVVRATGEIHLNSTWDEGIPDEIPHDHLYGLAWNPMTLIEVLQEHRRRGNRPPGRNRRADTDFAQLLPMAFPDAELVDGELAHARRPADQDRRRGRRAARGAAASPRTRLAAAVAELRAGRHRAGADRRADGGDGRRRGEHPRHAGRRMGHVARTLRGGAPAATAASPTATWSPSPRACWPTATSARSAAPGRSVTSTGPTRCPGASNAGMPCGTGCCGVPARAPRQRPARGVRGGRRTAAADAGRPRPRAGLRPAGGLAGPAEPPPPRKPSSRAWCWPSPATCGRQGVGAVFARDAVLDHATTAPRC